MDWSNPKPNDIGLNSAYDSKPTLNGIPVKKDLFKIDMITDEKLKNMNEDYRSRRPIIEKFPSYLTQSIDYYAGMVENIKSDEKIQGIQLYNQKDFEAILIGTWDAPGKLITLLTELKSHGKDEKESKPCEIVLINAPDTVEFKTFLSELTQTKTLRFNGYDYNLPENLKIKLMKRPYAFKGNYITRAAAFTNDFDIPLNIETFPYFFDCFHTNPKIDGLLKHYANKKLTLYITDEMRSDKDKLAKLIDEAGVYNVTLEFVTDRHDLPPEMLANSRPPEAISMDVDVDEVKSSAASLDTDVVMSADVKKAIEIYISSDIESAATVISSSIKINDTYSISPSHTYYNLFDHLAVDLSADQCDIKLSHHLGTIAHALLNNETVVLKVKGQMSSKLSKHLESLFAKKPYLLIKGKHETVTGKLIIVTDDETLFPFAAKQKKTITLPIAQKEIKEDKQEIKPALTLKLNPEELVVKVAQTLMAEKCVYIDGPTASGKSTLLQSLPRYLKNKIDPNLRPFNGLEQLENWATATGPDTHLLIIDNADLKAQNSFDFIKKLFDQPPRFLKSNGTWIQIPPNKKVIVTGDSSDKFYHIEHDAFKQHGVFITLPKTDRAALLNNVLLPYLNDLCSYIPEEKRREIANEFLTYFEFVLQKNVELTGRNLERMVERLHVFKENDQSFNSSLNFKVKMAIYDELHGWVDKKGRAELKQKLFENLTDYEKIKAGLLHGESKASLSLSAMDTSEDKIVSSDYILFDSRHKLWTQLDALFKMHQLKIQRKTKKSSSTGMDTETDEIKSDVTKCISDCGMLIEGPSGIGKTEIVLEFLKKKGLQEKIDFYHITPTQINSVKEILEKAASENKIVVLDEINISPTVYELLKNTSCTVIGSLNPSATFNHRFALPNWIKNRFQCIRAKSYKQSELISYCKIKGIEEKEAIARVANYENSKANTKKSSAPTDRSFFNEINMEAEKRKNHTKTKFSTTVSMSLKSDSSQEDNPDAKQIKNGIKRQRGPETVVGIEGEVCGSKRKH